MNILISGLLVYIFIASTVAYAEEFPKAPANLKEAESEGLQRVNLGDIKKVIPGIVKNKEVKGNVRKLTYKPDGTFDRTVFGNEPQTGKWNFDDEKNAYCTALQKKKGYKKNCFAVFLAKDGVNFIDYDLSTGFYDKVWHSGD